MKQYNHKSFNTGAGNIKCWTTDQRDGFTHYAQIWRDGESISSARVKYYNRTWEAFEYESVINNAIDKAPKELQAELTAGLTGKPEQAGSEQALGAILALGDIVSKSEAERNSWRLRMLLATYGEALQVPDDWEKLPEAIKTERLDKIEQIITKGGKQ